MTALLLLIGVSAEAQSAEPDIEMPQLDRDTMLYTLEEIVQEDSMAEISPPDSVAQQILDFAAKYLGRPYRYGANGPHSFDCSGFTAFVFKEFGYNLSHGCTRQVTEGQQITSRNALKPGDLVFFYQRNKRNIGHVGIVVENYGHGNVRFIHASTSRGVRYDDIATTYFLKRYITGVRVLREDALPFSQLPAE
ncbi:hypothetical protein AGMMS4957_19210 [Bacteroidia bacterium]|nr:hypothetical protein AGMMS4957_19210 [Bacteroidia bacterium]